jgi:UDP-N-acetylmuramyl pentapeptide phosphotransferase/UDP-N-acetylglucosamine-1-phosphate transferase
MLFIFLSFLISFAIVFSSIPTVVFIAKAKKLYDEPDPRKAHNGNVPLLGGMPIFAAILVCVGLFTDFESHKEFQYLIVSSVILFFIGLKDDILVTAPMKKLWGQLLSSLIIIVLGDVRLTNLQYFLGVTEINYFWSVLITLFVFIVIINGFNLIDGIDGLASGIGIVSTLFFGIWFFMAGENDYSVFNFAILGGLIAFFWFNVFSRKFKIFMGDAGSLLLGLFMAVMVIHFIEKNIPANDSFNIHSSPAVAIGILIVPLFDTLRVFVIRILNGRSPFTADKNHVHHKLLAMGLTHLQSTLCIVGANIFFIAFVLLLNKYGVNYLMLAELLVATLFSMIPEIIYFVKKKRQTLI